MARIDHTTYEAWLLDRQEGRLTPDQERELESFLLAHPDLRPDEEPLPTLDTARFVLTDDEKNRLKRALPPAGRVSVESLEDQLVARWEGDLEPDQEAALSAFLHLHPEFSRDERLYALSRVVPEPIAFPLRSGLHRSLPPEGMVAERTLDDHLVAHLEGDLAPGQQEALVRHLESRPHALRAWRLMQATRIAAPAISYPDKQSLKRTARVVPLFSAMAAVRWAAAASVLLLLGMAWWFSKPEPAPMAKKELGAPRREHVVEGMDAATGPKQPVAQDALVDDRTDQAVADHALPKVQPAKGLIPPSHPRELPIDEDLSLEQPLLAGESPSDPVDALHDLHPQTEGGDGAVLSSIPSASSPGTGERTIGQALAGALRERVLERPAEVTRPLGGDDAVAAIDRGLRAVGGERSGLALQRDEQGRGNGFALRLGRSLAITASR